MFKKFILVVNLLSIFVSSAQAELIYRKLNTDFTDLNDTPSSYSEQGGKFVKVNATEDALEFTTFSESDTLDTVCSRGATTNQAITTGRLTTSGDILMQKTSGQGYIYARSPDGNPGNYARLYHDNSDAYLEVATMGGPGKFIVKVDDEGSSNWMAIYNQLQLGHLDPSAYIDGTGVLGLYSDQGTTGYQMNIKPNPSMTQKWTMYLPAAVAGAESFLKMGTDGVIDYDASTYLAEEADTFDSVCDRGAVTDQSIITEGMIIDATSPEAFLVRQDGDTADVFMVDTLNKRVGINTTPTTDFDLSGYAKLSKTYAVQNYETISAIDIDYDLQGGSYVTISGIDFNLKVKATGSYNTVQGLNVSVVDDTDIDTYYYTLMPMYYRFELQGDGNIAGGRGLDVVATHSGTGDIQELTGLCSTVNADGTGTVTSGRAYLANITVGTNETLNNAYGLYIDYDIYGTCINKYGVYQVDNGVTNYFGGSVGIGEVAPDVPLHITATQTPNIRLEDTTANYAAYVEFYGGANRYGWVGIPGGSTPFINLGAENGAPIVLTGGNVGIADTTPEALFTVGNTDLFQVDSLGNVTLKTGQNFTIGTTQWNSGDEIDGTKIKDADYGDVSISAGVWNIEEADTFDSVCDRGAITDQDITIGQSLKTNDDELRFYPNVDAESVYVAWKNNTGGAGLRLISSEGTIRLHNFVDILPNNPSTQPTLRLLSNFNKWSVTISTIGGSSGEIRWTPNGGGMQLLGGSVYWVLDDTDTHSDGDGSQADDDCTYILRGNYFDDSDDSNTQLDMRAKLETTDKTHYRWSWWNSGAGSEVGSIDESGNLLINGKFGLIGTTPAYNIDIQESGSNNAVMRLYTITGHPQIKFYNGNFAVAYRQARILYGLNGSNYALKAQILHNNESVTFDNCWAVKYDNGYLGVGTDNPLYRLHVNGQMVSSDLLAPGTDPDVDAAGELGRDTNDHALRGYDESIQYVYGQKAKTIAAVISKPKNLAEADTLPVWHNKTGFTFNIVAIYSNSDTDNVDFTLKEVTDPTNFTALTTIEAVSITTDGISVYYDNLTAGIDHTVIENDHIIVFDNDAIDDPAYLAFTIVGYLDADVN